MSLRQDTKLIYGGPNRELMGRSVSVSRFEHARHAPSGPLGLSMIGFRVVAQRRRSAGWGIRCLRAFEHARHAPTGPLRLSMIGFWMVAQRDRRADHRIRSRFRGYWFLRQRLLIDCLELDCWSQNGRAARQLYWSRRHLTELGTFEFDSYILQ